MMLRFIIHMYIYPQDACFFFIQMYTLKMLVFFKFKYILSRCLFLVIQMYTLKMLFFYSNVYPLDAWGLLFKCTVHSVQL